MVIPKFLGKNHIHLEKNVAFFSNFYSNDVYEPRPTSRGSGLSFDKATFFKFFTVKYLYLTSINPNQHFHHH
jgi:hypothetical protein